MEPSPSQPSEPSAPSPSHTEWNSDDERDWDDYNYVPPAQQKADADSETVPDANADAIADADADADAYADANAYADADAYADANAYADTYADADADGYADAFADAANADAGCAIADDGIVSMPLPTSTRTLLPGSSRPCLPARASTDILIYIYVVIYHVIYQDVIYHGIFYNGIYHAELQYLVWSLQPLSHLHLSSQNHVFKVPATLS